MGNIEAIILAAGLSSRMGLSKLLLPFQDKTIIEKTVELVLAAGLDKINVVVGADREDLLNRLGAYSVRIIENPFYRQGMSTSFKAGVEQVAGNKKTEALLVFNGDMPLIRPDTVRNIIKVYEEESPLIVAPVYKQRRGHPVLFARAVFPELAEISGDRGAREIIARNGHLLRTVTVDDPGIFLDIDTGNDYRRALALAGERPL